MFNIHREIGPPVSNIDEKRVGKSPQEISTKPTFRNILTNLKKKDKTKMELPLDMVSISASSCRTKMHYSISYYFSINTANTFIEVFVLLEQKTYNNKCIKQVIITGKITTVAFYSTLIYRSSSVLL